MLAPLEESLKSKASSLIEIRNVFQQPYYEFCRSDQRTPFRIEYDQKANSERIREEKQKKFKEVLQKLMEAHSKEEGQPTKGLSDMEIFWGKKKAELRSEVEKQSGWKTEQEQGEKSGETEGESAREHTGPEDSSGSIPKAISGSIPKAGSRSSVDYMWEKSSFYFCMAFAGEILQRLDKKVWRKSGSSEKEREYLRDTVKCVGNIICKNFNIINAHERKLIGLALYHKARQFDREQSEKIGSEEERELYLSAFQHNQYDMDLVDGYVGEEAYGNIKQEAWASSGTAGSVQKRYDYYSDYYLYYTVAEMLRE